MSIFYKLKTSFMQLQRPYRLATYALCAVVIIGGLSSTVYTAMLESIPEPIPADRTSKSTETDLRTIKPIRSDEDTSTLLLGTAISNETANIFPRRNGIVEDIYVDIGDKVQKNQVVAVLLPQGVEGQSAAMIGEKQSRVAQAESELRTTEKVAEETIISARQKIAEKETELDIAQQEQDRLLQQFAQAELNVQQKQDQAFTTAQNARQLVESTVLTPNNRGQDTIRSYDMINTLGQLEGNDLLQVSVASGINEHRQKEAAYQQATVIHKNNAINDLLTLTVLLLQQTQNLLQQTPTSTNSDGLTSFSQQQLNSSLNTVVNLQDTVLKARESIEDAQSHLQELVAAESTLYTAYRRGELDNVKSNKVKMIESQLQTVANSLELTAANQEQMIENRKSQLDIAQSMLRTELTQSGHRQIRSPFTGVVSKRFIEVGQIVSPSQSAFELSGVPTTLAKEAKAVIQFGVPESWGEVVATGDTVAFFMKNDETTEYLAEVIRVSPQIDLDTQTITVQAKIPDDVTIPHQASVRVRIGEKKDPVFRVPSAAVKRDNQTNNIWILNTDSEPEKITVSVQAEEGEFAHITGNIHSGTLIILDPPDTFLPPPSES